MPKVGSFNLRCVLFCDDNLGSNVGKFEHYAPSFVKTDECIEMYSTAPVSALLRHNTIISSAYPASYPLFACPRTSVTRMDVRRGEPIMLGNCLGDRAALFGGNHYIQEPYGVWDSRGTAESALDLLETWQHIPANKKAAVALPKNAGCSRASMMVAPILP